MPEKNNWKLGWAIFISKGGKLLKMMFFLYSVILTEYVAIEPRVCVHVCMCVYVRPSLCVWQRCSPNGWIHFNETFYKWSDRYLRGPFLSDFDISKWMTSLRAFCTFTPGHSHGRNYALIFFKIADKVKNCVPVFAIKNDKNRCITLIKMTNRVFEAYSK